MLYLDDILAEITASGEDLACAGGVDEAVVCEYERFLGVAFPESYKLFLMRCGAMSFAGDTYYGITKSGINADAVPNVSFATLSARAQGEVDSHMVVVKSSGYGPLYSIDSSIIGSTGEAVIVETGQAFKRDGRKNVIYPSFAAFLSDAVSLAIRDLQQDRAPTAQ